MTYKRLRAAYDTAFRQFRQEVCGWQSVGFQAHPGRDVDNPAPRRVEDAMNHYRQRRNELADYLISTMPKRHQDLRLLAYRIWEESGRPLGNPDEHWYRAEVMLRGPQQTGREMSGRQ